MADELGLSQTQQTKIRAIYEAARGQFEGAMGDRTKMEALRKGIDSQIMAVLTPAQKSKLASMGGLEGLQITGRYRHELDQLGLSADQKHKTNVILNEMVSKVKAMRATMGPGGPGGGGPRGAGGPGGQRAGGGGGMRQVMEGYRAQIEAVLSASQKAKFEADMPAGGRGGRGGPGGGGGRGGGQGGGAR
jgi:Spy/CpxP family protein refolding chaperone